MTDERTAAMDALIADSAGMIDAPASADALGEVERVAKALAKADGLDWDEVCGVDADPDEGYCDSGTCVAAHWEEHDAEQARRWYMHLATAALSAMSPAWQDIATAPKDWDDVLVFSPEHEGFNNGGVFSAFYDPDEGAWITHGPFGNNKFQPTHWQPLPTPPEQRP